MIVSHRLLSMNATAIKTNKNYLKLSHWRLGSWDYLGASGACQSFCLWFFRVILGLVGSILELVGDLGGHLEVSWYRVAVGSEHVGISWPILESSPGGWRFYPCHCPQVI